jgi:molybdopterin-containing oxidoreductase family membrane subunit
MSIVVNIGMWFERFVIIVTSLYHDYLPSSWAYYSPTWPEIGFYLGTFGLFFTCYFLFCKYFPIIAIAEIKYVLKTSGEGQKTRMAKIDDMSDEEFLREAEHNHLESQPINLP